MHVLCYISHKWTPIKAFYTTIIDNKGKEVGSDESWTGYECERCLQRKIENNRYKGQSAGATQNAYDWLNEKRNKERELGL